MIFKNNIGEIFDKAIYFLANDLDNYVNKVIEGKQILSPKDDGIPSNLKFISDGDKYYAKVFQILVFDMPHEDDIFSESFVDENVVAAIVFDVKKLEIKINKRVVFLLNFVNESQNDNNLLYYTANLNSAIKITDLSSFPMFFYNINFIEKKVVSSSPLQSHLAPYYKYYHHVLQILESEKKTIKIQINMDLFKGNFDVFNNILPDEDFLLVPIIGNTVKLSSIKIATEYLNKKTDNFDFYNASLQTLSSEESNYYIDALKKSGIIFSENDTLAFLDITDLDNKAKINIIKIFSNVNISKCFIEHNNEGEKIRIKRIIYGIENSLLGKVANQELVNIISSNNLMGPISKLSNIKSNSLNDEIEKSIQINYPNLAQNIDQLNAINKILQMHERNIDLLLVQGPPGTGKTELILVLAKELLKRNYNVLMSSNVHVALDNFSERFKNNKEFVLKRYTTLRGEKFDNELLENQKRYIENQVLEGFKFKGNVFLNDERISKITEELDSLINQKKELNDLKKSYDKALGSYHLLMRQRTNITIDISELVSILSEENEKVRIHKNQINKLLIEINELDLVIKKYGEFTDKVYLKISNFFKDREDAKNTLIKIYREKDLINDNLKKITYEIEKEVDVLNRLNQLISLRNIDIEFLNSTSVIELKNDIRNFALTNKNFKTIFQKKLSENLLKSIEFLINLNELIKTESKLINGSGEISILTFQKVYFLQLNDINSHKYFSKNLFLEFEAIYNFMIAKPINKVFLKLFHFTKINNLNYRQIFFAKQQIYKTLRSLHFNFKKLIDAEIDSYDLEKDIDLARKQLTNEIETLSLKLEAERSTNEEKQRNQEDLRFQLDILNKKIDEKIKQISIINSKIDNDNLNNENKDKFVQIIKLLLIRKTKLHFIEETNNKLEEINKKISLNYVKMDVKKSELNTINLKIESFTHNNKELIEKTEIFYIKYPKEINKIELLIINIENVLTTAKQKIKLLRDNGWSRKEALDFLIKYTEELVEITESDNDKVKNFFNGPGNTFREIFSPTNNKNGSLISMTTNQVATLFKALDQEDYTFDYAIIDEASKCRFEDLIISLPRIKHLVLIGDFMQLDPIFDEYGKLSLDYQRILDKGEWNTLNSSNFSMLLKQFVNFNFEKKYDNFDSNPFVAPLRKQYRMNTKIFELISPIYAIHKGFEITDEKMQTSNDLICCDIDGIEQKSGTSAYNNDEANAIVEFLKAFSSNYTMYPNIKSIGIITGYRAQQNNITRKLKNFNIPGIKMRIGTFDRFQGREFDLVIVSLVRTIEFGFTNNIRRMNVAFSRAKSHLLIFGNLEALINIARKSGRSKNMEMSESENIELNFVVEKLIPKLYELKRTFASSNERTNFLLNYLLEQKYE